MSAQPFDTSVTSDESTLTQLNERYIESFMKADVEWYRAHLADDFLCIEANGSGGSGEDTSTGSAVTGCGNASRAACRNGRCFNAF